MRMRVTKTTNFNSIKKLTQIYCLVSSLLSIFKESFKKKAIFFILMLKQYFLSIKLCQFFSMEIFG
jgi:hypothetical protein